mmetsp:Transcript_27737/g.79666  ORF Transcript_27737/g.79666 Transcript_27737/m.79666 type:complete len:209 (+) Transcript_27737:2-628(+)
MAKSAIFSSALPSAPPACFGAAKCTAPENIAKNSATALTIHHVTGTDLCFFMEAGVWGARISSSSIQGAHSPSSSSSSLDCRLLGVWMCCCISSWLATTSLPGSAAQSSTRRGLVVPATCGKGHSRGKAWCSHCAKSRPCRGTLPPLPSATSSRRRRSVAGRLPRAGVVAEGMAATRGPSSEGVALGAPTSRSSCPSRASHSLMQQTE